MKTAQPDVEQYKTRIIVLSAIIVGCLILPLLIAWWLFIISVPVAAVCGYLIYRFYLDYQELADAKKLCDCVLVKEEFNVNKIAQELGWNNAKTRSMLELSIKKGYLEGYFRVGEELRKKEEGKEEDIAIASTKKTAKKCSHCGGVAEYYEGEKSVCVYCGNVIDE